MERRISYWLIGSDGRGLFHGLPRLWIAPLGLHAVQRESCGAGVRHIRAPLRGDGGGCRDAIFLFFRLGLAHCGGPFRVEREPRSECVVDFRLHVERFAARQRRRGRNGDGFGVGSEAIARETHRDRARLPSRQSPEPRFLRVVGGPRVRQRTGGVGAQRRGDHNDFFGIPRRDHRGILSDHVAKRRDRAGRHMHLGRLSACRGQGIC